MSEANRPFTLDDDDIRDLIDSEDIQDQTSFSLSPIAMNPPMEMPVAKPPIVIEQMTPESFDADFDYIRANIKDIIKTGQEALHRLLMLAQTSDQPRAYEVVAILMREIASANKDLLNSHKVKYETVNPSEKQGAVHNTQNNTIFVGSTSELSKVLKGRTIDQNNE